MKKDKDLLKENIGNHITAIFIKYLHIHTYVYAYIYAYMYVFTYISYMYYMS
jgi:hypothetical protein